MKDLSPAGVWTAPKKLGSDQKHLLSRTAGAPGAVRQGSSREEWAEGAAERKEERAELRAAIMADTSVPPHFRQLNRSSCKLEIRHPLLDPVEVLYHVPTDDEIRCVPLPSA